MRGRLRRRDRHRHVVGDHDDLGFQVDAVILADYLHRIARAIEAGTHRLIHQRIDIEAFRHLGATRAAHALDVRQIGAAIHEFIGARQGRSQVLQVNVERAFGAACIECVVERVEAGRDVAPVLQRLLQGRRDAGGAHAARKIAGNDDQRAIAAAFLQGTEFHPMSVRWETRILPQPPASDGRIRPRPGSHPRDRSAPACRDGRSRPPRPAGSAWTRG